MHSCSKVAYANRRDALLALRAISRAYARRGYRGPQGAYLCRPCGRWHLTSAKRVQTAPWMKGRPTR
jgi:hypothetical protein